MNIEKLKELRENLANAEHELSLANIEQDELIEQIRLAGEEKYGILQSRSADRVEKAEVTAKELEEDLRKALIEYGEENPEETNIIAGLSVSRPFALVGDEEEAVKWAVENNVTSALKVNTKDKRILNIVIAAEMIEALSLNKREFVSHASKDDDCDLVEKVVQPKITKKEIKEFAKDV